MLRAFWAFGALRFGLGFWGSLTRTAGCRPESENVSAHRELSIMAWRPLKPMVVIMQLALNQQRGLYLETLGELRAAHHEYL